MQEEYLILRALSQVSGVNMTDIEKSKSKKHYIYHKKGGDHMTDSEKLDLILSKLDSLDSETQELKRRTTNIELTLENETNRNIQLLAENHITLIDKLNQAIKVADKTLMYEVQMTSLKSRLEHLEKEVAEMKKATA